MFRARPAISMLFLLCCAPLLAHGASTVVAAGDTLSLDKDLVLTGADTLEIQGTPQKRCAISGQHRSIRTEGQWSGSIRIRFCDLKGLGGESKIANNQLAPEHRSFELHASGKALIEISDSAFDACGGVLIDANNETAVFFKHNLVRENCLAPVHAAPHLSRPFFTATGDSARRKLFTGNFVLCSWIEFHASDWIVGGDQDRESNFIIGPRAGVVIGGQNCQVRGNYIHALPPARGGGDAPYWSQVCVLELCAQSVAEQNILRGGHWNARNIEGELKNNVLLEPEEHEWIQSGSAGNIHHNIFWSPGPLLAGIEILGDLGGADGKGAEIYNNVFDGAGRASFAPITVANGGFIKSLRNNVFANFTGGPLVRSAWNESPALPGPARLGYADYNLFFNGKGKGPVDYQLTVAGKAERKQDGFARNDVPKGGKDSQQVQPRFSAQVRRFPFKLSEILRKKVPVSQMLEFFHKAYLPAEGSPLIDAGNPADGAGTDIGAVEAGKIPPSGPGLAPTSK